MTAPNEQSERLGFAGYFQNVILSEAKDPRKVSYPAPRQASKFPGFAQEFGRWRRRRLSDSALPQNDTSLVDCAIRRDVMFVGGLG